jgi:hypothetical protein
MIFRENPLCYLYMSLTNSSLSKCADNTSMGHISLMKKEKKKKTIQPFNLENWRNYCKKYLPFG